MLFPQILAGPSTTQSPYLVASRDGVWLSSLLSSGDVVGTKADGVTPWRLVGVPDGLGAYDNGDGTITVLMNHELAPGLGDIRAHGASGAFVSKLVIDKSTLAVTSAQDLDQRVLLFNSQTGQYEQSTVSYARFCSADLPAVTAFFDAATGLGTQDRIFMNGEETGAEGRAFAHIVTGLEAGTAYELPWMGNFSMENLLASPYSGARTVVIGQDDSSPGEVYLYIGDKKAAGTTIEKAGLTGGQLFGILADFGDDAPSVPSSGRFSLVAQGNNGDASRLTGAELNAAAAAITQFGRPEDGAWDPSNPNRYYLATTGTATIPTRLWALDFADVEHPELGGTIRVLVEGGLAGSNPAAGPVMFDNMTVTEQGLVILQEDPGGNARLGKIWMYDPAAAALTEIAQHDPARFLSGGLPAPFATTGFGQDEESSGIFDVTSMMGDNEKMVFLLDSQAHYTIAGELVQGGQLQLMTVEIPNAGATRYLGTIGHDVFDGGFGNDTLGGNRGNDRLSGNYGDDKISGGTGDDVLDGGAGNDNLVGQAGNDRIAGDNGDDRLSGEFGNDVLSGGVGADIIYGGAGLDVITGGFGDDLIYGNAGNDVLKGDQGADRIEGGQGNDILDGGNGNDKLLVFLGNDTVVLGKYFGHDVVYGFDANASRGQDLLDLRAFGISAVDFATRVVIAGIGNDTLVTIDGTETVRLDNVTDAATVTITDFVL